MHGQIVIVTCPADPHADAVIHHLSRLGVDVVRYHAAESHVDTDISLTSDKGSIAIASSGRTIDLNNVRSVWYRRPDSVDNHVGQLRQPDRHLVAQETSAVVWGLYGLIDAVWYSHPYNIRRAAWKLYQLATANRLRLKTPRYIVSNSETELQEFAQSSGAVVIKPIDERTTCFECDGEPYSLYVKKLSPLQLKELVRSKPVSPVLLQDYVPKKYDVRITSIGHEHFVAAILQPSGAEIVDFRPASLDLEYEVLDCPAGLGDKLTQYMKVMGLNFAAFDFVVDHDGQWHFLECNPNGQWLWIEMKTGLPLVESLARHLTLDKPCVCKGSQMVG